MEDLLFAGCFAATIVCTLVTLVYFMKLIAAYIRQATASRQEEASRTAPEEIAYAWGDRFAEGWRREGFGEVHVVAGRTSKGDPMTMAAVTQADGTPLVFAVSPSFRIR